MMKAVWVLRLLNAAAILAVVGGVLRNSGRIYQLTGSVRCKEHRHGDLVDVVAAHDYTHLSGKQRLGHRLVNGQMEHTTTVAYGGVNGPIIGGRVGGRFGKGPTKILLKLSNTDPFFTGCKHPISLQIKLEDFKEEARTNRRTKSRDTHRLTFNIGTCHLDTGKCDDDGDFPKPPAPAAPAPAAPAAPASAPAAATPKKKKEKKKEAKKSTPDARIFGIRGEVVCDKHASTDRILVHVTHDEEKDADTHTNLYDAPGILIGGKLEASTRTITVKLEHKGTHSKCNKVLEMKLQRALFKEEPRLNRHPTKDKARLIYDIGKCHLDTGKCHDGFHPTVSTIAPPPPPVEVKVYGIKGKIECNGHPPTARVNIEVKHNYAGVTKPDGVKDVDKHTSTYDTAEVIIGGHTGAPELTVTIANKGQSKVCDKAIELTLKLKDFKSEARLNRKTNKDKSRLYYDIGKCNLKTGKCGN